MRPRTVKIELRHLARQGLRDRDRLLVANSRSCKARPRAASPVSAEPLLCTRPVTAPCMKHEEMRGAGRRAHYRNPICLSPPSPFPSARQPVPSCRHSVATEAGPSGRPRWVNRCIQPRKKVADMPSESTRRHTCGTTPRAAGARKTRVSSRITVGAHGGRLVDTWPHVLSV